MVPIRIRSSSAFFWKDIDFWTMKGLISMYNSWYVCRFAVSGSGCHWVTVMILLNDNRWHWRVWLFGVMTRCGPRGLAASAQINEWLVKLNSVVGHPPWAHFWGLFQILAKKKRVFLGWITNWLSIDHWNCLVWHVFWVLALDNKSKESDWTALVAVQNLKILQ